ncbi:glycosyltransferase family 4 protein [Pseudomonas sp. MT3]|nr:glycosyltransferase family 4 protein [uncultured Pseudomonas sp.]
MNNQHTPPPFDDRDLGQPPRRLRILHVAETIQGGVASYLETLDKTSPHDNRFLIPGSQAHCTSIAPDKLLPFKGERRLTRIAHLFKALHGALRRERYDLIHLHSSLAGYVFVLRRLALLKSPPAVYCAHGWSFLRETSRLEHLACRSLDFLTGVLANGIIHISRTEQARAAFIPNANQAVLYNPIDPHYIAQPPSTTERSANTVLFVGRLDYQKGFDVLYRAFLDPALQDCRLLVAGSSVLASSAYGETANVRFLGWQNKESLHRLYEQATLTIMPSRWEGFGLVAIESLARGTQVLVNQTGSLPEIVAPVGLVADLSRADTLVEQLRHALDAPPRHTPEALHAFVRERFAPERFARELSAFYARTLGIDASLQNLPAQS